ncbi:MAG: hypothetical protein V4662_05910 [Verrucomicrobiota bacterium]
MIRSSLLVFLSATLLQAQTCACTIPVFRYALDRWETDRFKLSVPSNTSQNAELTDILRPLRANGKANFDIATSRDPALAKAELFDSKTSSQTLWSGDLDKASLAAVLDSPGRSEILKRILSGESVVWVIVDSGNPEDQAEIARIEKRLKFLENVAALPIQDPNDPDSQLGPGPALLLKFTTLHLRRDDPAEKLLITMLAGPTGKVDPAQGAFAAAVFGKGRVLGAWPLTQLDDMALEEACMFLVGRCSCRLKNDNPGWDILLNVDWPKALQEASDKRTATTTASEPAKPVEMKHPETVVTQAQVVPLPAATASAATTSPGAIPQSSILLASSALLLGCVVMLLRKSKSR